jgi:O-antigen/teichoic acid export membrane protein
MVKENQSTSSKGSSILKNFSFLTSGQIVGDIFTFFLFVLLSRTFGEKGIGQYSFAMAFTGFFAVLSDFGLYTYTIKEVSRRKSKFIKCFGNIFSLRLALSLAFSCFLFITVYFLPFPSETKLVILIIGFFQILSFFMDGIGATFVAHEDSQYSAMLSAAFRGVAALAGILVMWSGGSLVATLITLPVTAFVFLLIAYGIMKRQYGTPSTEWSIEPLKKTMNDAKPYAISGILAQIYSRLDVVLLGFFWGEAFAGVYNVGYRIIFLLIFLPHYASVAILPMTSQLFDESKKELKSLYHKSINTLILITLPMTAGLWLLSNDIIELIFGKNFTESATVLSILSVLLVLTSLDRIMGTFLMSCDRQKTRTKCHFIAMLTNLISNLLLIPLFGVIGAAISAVIGETILVILFMLHLKDITGLPKVGKRLLISFTGIASFFVPFSFYTNLSILFVIPVSIILYGTILMLFKDIRDNEIHFVYSKIIKQFPFTK